LIIVFASLVVVAIEAIFLRSRLSRVATLRLRRMYLVWVALAVQILVISILPGGAHVALALANLLTYLAAGLFVWSNRKVPGVLLLGLGGGLNVLAMSLNGGTMPASTTALRASGWHPAPGHFANSAIVAHPKLAFLGDVFATPHWMPFHDVFSVGDLLIVVAIGVLVYRTCSRTPANHTEPAAPTSAGESAHPGAKVVPAA
jgi:Family of unknown function (DUF5317)